MPHAPLQFKILGQVSPILAWTEGENGSRLPSTWTTERVQFQRRERGWFSRELPTYSYDNVKDIVQGTREEHRSTREPTTLPFPEDRRFPRLSPPADYDLMKAFRELHRHFFVWNGTELCIKEGRMEELHELAIRLPAGHIVRQAHARAIAEGVMTFEEALELPELITLLPSNSFGLRSVVRKGLSESHLHLTGVISAEESWADNLLRPLSSRGIQGESLEERRLLLLNLFAGRLLALAVWLSLVEPEEDFSIRPRRLLALLDRVYFARSIHEEHQACGELDRALRRAVYGHRTKDRRFERHREELSYLKSGMETRRIRNVFDKFWQAALINRRIPESYHFLMRWMAPTAFRLGQLKKDQIAAESLEDLKQRYRFVHQLHLSAHLRLIRLSREGTAEKNLAKNGDWRESDPRRFFLHEALFRYLVCRTHHWQSATQQGRTTGLLHFKEYFGSKQRKLSEINRNQQAELTMDRLKEWRGLRVLEGRVSPPMKPYELMPWIRAYTRLKDQRIQKFGLVVHFKKEDEEIEDRGFSSFIDSPVPRLRWGRRRRLIRDEALRLYRLLQRPTPINPFVVGIDACNLELATPPEVFAPVFRFLRELPISLTGKSSQYSPFFELEPSIRRLLERRRIGMSYHVGEDFRHLLSGLRAICEVVDFLKPNPGDRLGHGTALALHPTDWLNHNGFQAVLPKLEWLDTLVWVHHFLGPGDEVVGRLEIEDRIQRYSWDIYSGALRSHYDPMSIKPRRDDDDDAQKFVEETRKGLLDWDWSPLALWDAWTLRQLDPYSVDFKKLLRGRLELKNPQGFCDEDRRWRIIQEKIIRQVEGTIGSRNACLLLGLYWMSPDVRREGEKVVVVDMQEQEEDWLELCRRVEEKMKKKIHEKELVVEVNPSSNRIIGPMDRYGQHHVFHLTLDENRRLKQGVRVSVNTDNPAVCHTTLAHEHYLLGEILMREMPEAEVVEWLEWLRQNGQDYNFVRRLRTADEDPDMKKLVTRLRSDRPSVLEERSRKGKLKAFWEWNRETALRDRGYSREAIESDQGLLRRLVALEDQLRGWQARELEEDRLPDLLKRIREARKTLEEVRRKVVVEH